MWIDKLGNEITEDMLEDMSYKYYNNNLNDADIVRLIEKISKQRSIAFCGVDFSIGEIVRQMAPALFSQVRDEEIKYRVSKNLYELGKCAPENGDPINMFSRVPLDDWILWRETEDDE